MSEEKLLNPYLNFPGTAEEAINFYKSVLGGEILGLHRFGDTSHADKIPEAARTKIMHGLLKLGDGTSLMVSDNAEHMNMPFVKGTNITLSLHPASESEADRLYNGLSEGGNAMMPMQKTFWNAYFGMLEDKFGIQWMVNYSYPENK